MHTEAEKRWAKEKFQEWADEDRRTRAVRHYRILLFEVTEESR